MFLLIFAIILLITGIIIHRVFMIEARKYSNKAKEYEARREIGETDRYGRMPYDSDISEMKDSAKNKSRAAKIIFYVALVLCIALIVSSTVAIVPTGYTGIKTTFGRVENDVLASGINFVLPWQNVINMDNREQRAPFTLEAFSKDIQQVDIQGSINLNIDKTTAMNLYKDVGVGYWDILVTPRVYEDVKIVIAKYTAENLVENRQKASDQIFELLKQELSIKGINVISFAIENIDFTDAFEAAVEAKQVATQEKQKAQTEQERQTMEQQQQAERERIKAQAAADVQKIEADAQAYAVKVQAEAQAEANKEIAATLSDPLIRYNLIHQWDGKLPTVSGGQGMANILNIQDLIENE